MSRALRWKALGVLLLAGAAAPGRAQRPIPAASLAHGTLSFDGHASLGDFVGTTDSARGEMTGGETLAAVRGWVEATVAALRTGNDRRDRDLRHSMEVERYPTMRFDLAGVTAGAWSGDTASVTLLGTLTIHGVAREVSLPGTVIVTDGQTRVRCDFPLNLKDYRIGGLSKMLGVLKMHEGIEVHVDLEFAPRTGR